MGQQLTPDPTTVTNSVAGELQGAIEIESFDPSQLVTIGNLLNIPGTLRTHLTDPLDRFFTLDESPTADGIAEYLMDNSDFITDAEGVFLDGVMLVSLDFEIDRKIELGLDLSELLGNLGAVEASSDPFVLDIEMDFGLTFGLDLNAPGTVEDQFFIQIEEIKPELSLVAENIDFGFNVGFLEAGCTRWVA